VLPYRLDDFKLALDETELDAIDVFVTATVSFTSLVERAVSLETL
jgi:hypothetical protein